MQINPGDIIEVREENWSTTGVVVGTETGIGPKGKTVWLLGDFGGTAPGRAPIINGELPPGWTIRPA